MVNITWNQSGLNVLDLYFPTLRRIYVVQCIYRPSGGGTIVSWFWHKEQDRFKPFISFFFFSLKHIFSDKVLQMADLFSPTAQLFRISHYIKYILSAVGMKCIRIVKIFWKPQKFLCRLRKMLLQSSIEFSCLRYRLTFMSFCLHWRASAKNN